MEKIPEIYIVSDSVGETAESVAKATIAQFDEDIEITRIPFVRHTEQIKRIVQEASESGAMICNRKIKKKGN